MNASPELPDGLIPVPDVPIGMNIELNEFDGPVDSIPLASRIRMEFTFETG